jgi:hypothetical protein
MQIGSTPHQAIDQCCAVVQIDLVEIVEQLGALP